MPLQHNRQRSRSEVVQGEELLEVLKMVQVLRQRDLPIQHSCQIVAVSSCMTSATNNPAVAWEVEAEVEAGLVHSMARLLSSKDSIHNFGTTRPLT